MVFEQVLSMLNDTTDDHEIQNVLDTVCDHLPQSISNECEKLVAEFTVKNEVQQYFIKLVDNQVPVLQWIAQEASPGVICSGLKLCREKAMPRVSSLNHLAIQLRKYYRMMRSVSCVNMSSQL